MVGGLAVLIYFAATGKLTSSSSSSSSGSGSGGGLGSSTPPTYFLSVGSGDSFESPNVNPQIVDGGFVQGPAQSAYQPFVMTFTQALAGTGITYQGQNYDPPLSTTAPDGVQYGFLQPAHSNTVTMTTQVVGLTTGSQYQVSYYYSQRSSTTTDPNPFSTAMYMSFQVVLDGTRHQQPARRHPDERRLDAEATRDIHVCRHQRVPDTAAVSDRPLPCRGRLVSDRLLRHHRRRIEPRQRQPDQHGREWVSSIHSFSSDPTSHRSSNQLPSTNFNTSHTFLPLSAL